MQQPQHIDAAHRLQPPVALDLDGPSTTAGTASGRSSATASPAGRGGRESPLGRRPLRQPFPPSTKAGQVFVFGSAVSGELGLGKSSHERRKPGNVKWLNEKEVVSVECGGQHTLALDRHGRVWSWGVNDQGALGRMTDEDLGGAQMAESSDDDSDDEMDKLQGNEAFVPNLVDIRDEQGRQVFATQVVCADNFSAALTRDGHVYAWGSFRDPNGIIGFNKAERQFQRFPNRIMAFGEERVILLGSGENHVFAVTAEDTLWAFGSNDENQLGRRACARFKNFLEPYEIRGAGKRNTILHNIVRITGGAFHTLYINTKGELYAFGCNHGAQLGLGDKDQHINGPERVEYCILADGKTRAKLPPIVDIAAGNSHSLAVAADGRIFGWGTNTDSQIGIDADRPVYGDERDLLSLEELARLVVPQEKAHQQAGARKVKAEPVAAIVNTTPGGRRQSVVNDLASQMHLAGSQQLPTATLPDSQLFKLKFQPIPREIPRLGDRLTGEGGFAPESVDPVVMVDAQSRFSVAVTSLGRLYTWGSGHCYQLGNEEMEDEKTPFKVDLKNRKCFGAACGGQFLMFMLEPKRDNDTPPLIEPQATAPGSPNGSRRGSRGNLHFQQQQQEGSNGGPSASGNGGALLGFSAGAGGATQFASYRAMHNPVPSSSLPGSPVYGAAGKRASLAAAQLPLSDIMDTASSPLRRSSRSSSPDKLLAAIDQVCVSPDRKRMRAVEDALARPSPQYTNEERMAAWSPTRKTPVRSPLNSPLRMTFGSGVKISGSPASRVNLNARFAAAEAAGMPISRDLAAALPQSATKQLAFAREEVEEPPVAKRSMRSGRR